MSKSRQSPVDRGRKGERVAPNKAAIRFFETSSQKGGVAFRTRPLTSKERRTARSGLGELGAAATLYLNLVAAHQIHSEKTGSTEAQKLASIGTQFDSIPIVNPVVAASLMRFVSLGIKGLEPDLPKPPPFVVMYALAMLNKSMGMGLAQGGQEMSAEEFVAVWGLSEWLQQNPAVRVSHEELANLIASERQRTRARKPRRKRLLSRYLENTSAFSVSELRSDGKVTLTEKVTGASTTVQWESIERARRRRKSDGSR